MLIYEQRREERNDAHMKKDWEGRNANGFDHCKAMKD